jgi:F-type H+-transporting ATPase subunit 8
MMKAHDHQRCTPASSETNIWKQRILQAAMPQLIPFYFVNEVTTAFIIMPTLIYIFSKYLLPQRVRMMCARLFISKL